MQTGRTVRESDGPLSLAVGRAAAALMARNLEVCQPGPGKRLSFLRVIAVPGPAATSPELASRTLRDFAEPVVRRAAADGTRQPGRGPPAGPLPLVQLVWSSNAPSSFQNPLHSYTAEGFFFGCTSTTPTARPGGGGSKFRVGHSDRYFDREKEGYI